MTRTALYKKVQETQGREWVREQARLAALQLAEALEGTDRQDLRYALAEMEAELEQMKMVEGSWHREKLEILEGLEELVRDDQMLLEL